MPGADLDRHREEVEVDLGLQDKVAVVLAASSGLGKAAAAALLEEGARVAICARDEKKLGQAHTELGRSRPERVSSEALDVTDADQLRSFLQRVHKDWGKVDILVTNAGGPPTGTATSVELEDLDLGYRLTLKSAVVAIRTVLPWMQAQKWGRIIAMTSSSVRQPIDNLVMSNTMRAGLTGYLKTLSREVAKDGVLVNSICTGMFMTDRLKELIAIRASASGRSIEAEGRLLEADIPLGRTGDPEEFGAVVAFLASERATFITGIALPCDGGAGRHLL
jgi:3-oxoacyl-[acyl-carrier protein] reductase